MTRSATFLLYFTCLFIITGAFVRITHTGSTNPAGRISPPDRTDPTDPTSRIPKNILNTPTPDEDLIEIPEPPQTQGYMPTSIKDFRIGNPADGISLIEAPNANSLGNASLTFNLQLPEGRLGMQPVLSIQYNSDAGNSWLGYGWNLSTPAISIDTRWGVPRYDTTYETEMYMLNGEQLAPLVNRRDSIARTTDKVFHPRVEGDFQKIIRHGNNPSGYWWEVTEKNGTSHYYGGKPGTEQIDNAVLKDDRGNVAYWALVEDRDLNSNFVRYTYSTVSDPGILNSTLPGRQLYLNNISYTGNNGVEGPYKISFTRDRDLNEARRKDITIDARLGFKSVSADLLREINITYNTTLIRSYELQYEEGAFYKTLLKSISELDDKKTVFYTHRFDYYDDVHKQDYHPTDSTISWNIPGDGLDGGIENPIPGFSGEATALGATSAHSTTAGTGVTVGTITGGTWSKKASVGGFFNYTEDYQQGLVSMIDINGDGLPDKVFKDGGLYYRPNLGLTTHGFGDRRPITGIAAFSSSSSQSIGGGVQAVPYIGFFGYDHTEVNTTTQIYFSDFNGDGLMDIAADGQVYFNHLNAQGDPEFTTTSDPTPCPIFRGSVDTSFLKKDTALQSRQEKNFPLEDIVRVWEAPFTGTVTINAPVQLIENPNSTSAASLKKDGVRVSIQQDNTVLWYTTIGPGDYSIKVPANVSNLTVTKGHHIYFRLQSIYNGQDDQVSWDPVIDYSTPQVPTTDHKVSSHYQASADYILHAKGVTGLGKNGAIAIDGYFKKDLTTDTVTLSVIKQDSLSSAVLFQRDYAPAELADGNLVIPGQQTVTAGEGLQFTIRSRSYIDRSALQWTPHFAYVAFDDNTPVTTTKGTPTLQGNPVPDNSNYNTRLIAVGPVTISQKDTVVLRPRVAGSGTSGTLWLTIKGDDTIYARRHIIVSGGTMNPVDSIRLIRQPNSPYYLEYATDTMDFALSLQPPSVEVFRDSNFIKAGMNKDTLIHDTTLPANLYTNPAREFLGPLFRGWGQFALKGDKGDGPINESALNLNELNGLPSDPSNFEDSSALTGLQNPSQTNFSMLFPDALKQQWIGYDTSVYVTGNTMSSSRLGMHDVSVDSMAGGSAGTVNKKSRTILNSFSGGLFLGPAGASAGTSLATTTTLLDVMDMNGDLYPDVVNGESIQYTLPTGRLLPNGVYQPVGETTDKGFAAGGGLGGDFTKAVTANNTKAGASGAENTAKHSIGLSGGVENNDEESVSSWMDINGDGLTDRIYNDGNVALNLGYSFAAPEPWGLEAIEKGNNLSEGAGLGVDIDGGSIEAGIGLSRTTARNSYSLNDVNGDGLPDQLFEDVGLLSGGSTMRVRLNTGNGFGPAIPWTSFNEITCNTATGEAINGAFTIVIPIPIIFIKFCINPSVNVGHGISRQQDMVMDIDGDGYADRLHSTNEDNLTSSISSIGRTNMLRTVKGPLGASFTLDYAHTDNSYDMPQSKWVLKSVAIFDGVKGDGVDTMRRQFSYEDGYQDRREREFCGFGRVISRDLNTAGNNNVYRSHIQQFLNTFYTRGLVLSEWMEDAAGHRFAQTNNQYDQRTVQDDVQFPALQQTQKQYYEGAATPGASTLIQYDYDTLGNITRIRDLGDGSQQDTSMTTIKYHDPAGVYVRSVPSDIRVFTAEGLRRRRATDISDQGDIIAIRQYLADGKAAQTDITYDKTYGNVTKVTSPANDKGQRMSYTYEYDSAVHTYTTKITDAIGYITTNTYDYRFGVLTGTVNRNDEAIRYTLDNHGRVVTFTGPYELAAGRSYTIALSYHTDTTTASYAETKHFDPEYGSDISMINFVDGLGRSIQVKKQISLFKRKGIPDEVKMAVAGRQLLDAFGRAEKTFYPVTEDTGSVRYTLDTTLGKIRETNTYDVQDRILKTILADGATSTSAYTTGDGMLLTRTTDALNNIKETGTDVRGRIRSLKEYGANGAITTRYDYNALNELEKVTDNKGNKFLTTWDNFGRKSEVQHPDGGRTSLTYDLSGNLIKKTTAEIRQDISDSAAIQYQYDYNRLTDIDYPRNYQNKVKYIYGGPGTGSKAGRVVLQEDAGGGQEFFYGLQGSVKKTIRTILINPLFATTYISEQEYDTWGRIKKIIYPDGEELLYHYNRSGSVSGMEGQKQGSAYAYVEQIGYDEFEDRTYMRYGNGTETTYKYDSLRRRLAQLQMRIPTGENMINNSYTYDAESNLLNITGDVQHVDGQLGGHTSYTYHYDDSYRPDSVSGEFQGSGSSSTYGVKISYDDLYNITRKTMHGANSYDNIYTYGNTPHQATQIGTNKYTYDASGNQKGAGDMENFYDEANRLMAVVNKGVLSQYTYDVDDRLVIRSSGGLQSIWVNGAPAGTVKHNDNYTAYVSPYLADKKATYTKYYFIEGQRVASKLGHGTFINISFPQSGLTAGNVDYIRRAAEMENNRTSYYASLGVSPGPPTDKNFYAKPENSGIPAPVFVDSSAADSVPRGWPGNTTPPPNGPPVFVSPIPSNDSVRAGYGFQDAGHLYENSQYFFHEDHTGSTAYVSNWQGTMIQHEEYSPFGETFVEEHTGSYKTPYLFNGKEKDDQTGYYIYGARYYDPTLSQWMSVLDPLGDRYPDEVAGYGIPGISDDDDDDGSSLYMNAAAVPGKPLDAAENAHVGRGKDNEAKAVKNQAKKATTPMLSRNPRLMFKLLHQDARRFRKRSKEQVRKNVDFSKYTYQLSAIKDQHRLSYGPFRGRRGRRNALPVNSMAPRARRAGIRQGGNGSK